MNPELPKEFRLKRGSSILNYINRFSATEKTVFGILVIIAGLSAFLMTRMVSDYFLVEIPKTGGELREGEIGLPHVVNPVLAVTDVDRDLSALIYSGLMKYNNGNLVTDLAASYKISDDGLVYSFKLKPNLYWSDNTPLTTADVVFTIQKIQNVALKSPRRGDWKDVAVSVVSSDEVQFTLKQPYSPFITNTTIGILPKHLWQNLTDDQFSLSEYNIEPVGSGPYILESLTRDAGGIPTAYHLVASKKYYDKKPFLSAITVSFFADAEKAVTAIKNGTIDSLASVSSEQAEEISSNENDSESVLSTPLPRIFGVFFNQNDNPVLADKNVRDALNLSVDRKAIVEKILDGYGQPIWGALPFGMNSSTTSSQNDLDSKANLAQAKTILEKNGWLKNPTTSVYEKKGTKNTLQVLTFDIYTADTSDLKEAAEMVKNSWNTLGAKVNVKVFEPTDLYQNVIRPRKYDALLFGQLIGKDRDFYAFWHSSQRLSPGLNVAMYTNTQTDNLISLIRSTNDDSLRKEKYAELDRLIRADIPAVFLYSPDFIYIVPKTLKDSRSRNKDASISLNNLTIPADRFNSVSDWYIETEKVWKIFAN